LQPSPPHEIIWSIIQPRSREQEIVVDLKKADPLKLIKCDNAKCGRYSFEQDIEKNNWECPHCGRPFSMPERNVRSEVSLRETVVPSYVCDNKEKLRDLIEFLISQERAITVQIEGNKTSYTSRIITAVYRGIPSQQFIEVFLQRMGKGTN
jgi:acetyl-CoA carboxylase beta subunit